jgi:benzaldehyde dehydrogenase (NAD)
MADLLDAIAWQGKVFDGSWRDPAGGTAAVREPATDETLAEVGVGNAADVARATAAAAAAQPGWAETSWEQRARVLRSAAQLLEDHAASIAEWVVRETGSIPGKADFEVHGSFNEVIEAAAIPSQPYGHLLPAAQPGRMVFSRRVPLGVVGVITPWNFPLLLAWRAVAPALALGNTVVLKPDLQTPVTGGVVVARVLEEAGLPSGVLHMLPGDAEPGEALVTDPDVAMISFTGSSVVGRRVGELAGKGLKRVLLELGGNNALIVLDDADLERASSAGAWGAFLHQGQICMAASRHLVHERVADEYVERLSQRANALPVGDPHTEAVALGPIINETQLAKIDSIVNDSVADGAKVAAGATHDGPFYRPTVLEAVTPTMRAFREEIFGPVAPVTVISSDDEAVELANQTEYGLTAAVQSGSISRGLAIANRLKTGMVHVNDQTVNDEANTPFGGMGASGNGGRFGGHANADEFSQWQLVSVRDEPIAYPF